MGINLKGKKEEKKDDYLVEVQCNEPSVFWNQKTNQIFIRDQELGSYLHATCFDDNTDPETSFAEHLVKWNLPFNIEELAIAKFNDLKRAKNIHLEQVKDKRNKLVKSYSNAYLQR